MKNAGILHLPTLFANGSNSSILNYALLFMEPFKKLKAKLNKNFGIPANLSLKSLANLFKL
jgi:hypothetical protein